MTNLHLLVSRASSLVAKGSNVTSVTERSSLPEVSSCSAPGSAALGKSLNLSEPLYPRLPNRSNQVYFPGLLGENILNTPKRSPISIRNHSPSPTLTPGNCQSTFCFYEFVYSGCFIETESYNL